MLSISAAPAKQSVSETITVLSGRLNSATLLEDRRAAIRGLRSFAKEYPASVASGALRSLIGSLSKDREDVDTVEVVLQTLLLLFHPNENSPEASDEIFLWVADEFTQRQDNITLLLDFLEANDFYSRLLSMQLLSAILAARADRTEECIFTAPLGISRLVAILDDKREAIRAEAITLLTFLTATSTDIQKLVAFEGAFERLFSIIVAEGSLKEGSRTVEDCLILLANLLRLNTSNQSLFRESGWVRHLARLLESVYATKGSDEEVAPWAASQGNRNIYALLAVVRLFLIPGAVGTSQNQTSFWQHGVLSHTLQLAFSPSSEVQIKAEGLTACADMIRGNSRLQEAFAQDEVPSPLKNDSVAHPPATNGVHQTVYVIDGLLDLALGGHEPTAFDARIAACECLKAYFFNHPEIRTHFLQRAIAGHQAGVDETANVLTTLLRGPGHAVAGDPYRYWFAAVIMLHILFDNHGAKELAMAVAEGDASSGEEVVTSIQIITDHLISCIATGQDSRIATAYIMLLTTWLFEDLDAVNDLLGEGSSLHRLIQAMTTKGPHFHIVQGLCAMLVGIVYEFSTKDSPVSRATLFPLLTSGLGREKYIDYLTKLRNEPAMRDFEVLPQKLDPSNPSRLPDVFFDPLFVDFFKDNYRRLMRAIDRDPGEEISVVTNGVQKGISRELVDSLRSRIEEKDKALQDAETRQASLERQLGQEKADHRRCKETMALEMSRATAAQQATDMRHENELKALRTSFAQKEEDYKSQLNALRKLGESELDRIRRRSEADSADLRATISRLEVDLMKVNKLKTSELQTARERFDQEISKAEFSLRATEQKIAKTSKDLQAAQKQLAETKDLLLAKEEDRQSVQNELDDTLMVLNDVEEKATTYKKRLQVLNEEVSDVED